MPETRIEADGLGEVEAALGAEISYGAIQLVQAHLERKRG